jgi:hypothetical protein
MPLVFLLLALAAIAPSAIGAQTVTRRLAVTSDVAVRLIDIVGTVNLVGWGQDSLVVTGTLPAGVRLYVGGKDGSAKVAFEGPVDSAATTGTATLEVRVPRGARVSVRGVAVSLDAGGLDGELTFTSARGRLHLEGAPRRVSAETLDGNIEIVGPVASTRVRTASGAITLRGITGDLVASSVSGAIRVGGARVTEARLETVSGEISWKGSIAQAGGLEAQTMTGDIELRLPVELGADLQLAAPAGAVTSEWPLTRSAAKGAPIRTSIGDGGASVIARTFKGRISLVKQPEVEVNVSPAGGVSGSDR